MNVNRVLAFKLGGTDTLPPLPTVEKPKLTPPRASGHAQDDRSRLHIYHRYCSACHGPTRSAASLRRTCVIRRRSATRTSGTASSATARCSAAAWASSDPSCSRDDVEAIRDYVISRANEAKDE